MIFYFSEFKVQTQAKRRSEIKHQKSSKKEVKLNTKNHQKSKFF